jgi:hypothetical protein
VRFRLAWLTGGALAGLLFFRRRTRRPAPELEPAFDPAAELRRKLDESRSLAGEREEFESAETTVDEAPAPGELHERRQQVHDRGRAAVEEMRGDADGS